TAGPDSVVRRTEVDRLHYIGCGVRQRGTTEILRHARFSGLLAHLTQGYDFVLLTAPPVLGFADAAIVGQFANLNLMVLRSAEHRQDEIRDAAGRLRVAGVPVAGAILNRVGERASSYGYRGYGHPRHQYA
ncbi:MAG TPA: hypothetical protein VLI06_07895, partial [Solimonas sp.]|nr:hypothetical protein [Solimonas sp.]